MRARLWYRVREFTGRHANKIAYLFAIAAMVIAVAGVRWEADQRDTANRATLANAIERDRLAAVERRQQICDESRNLRALVSELIDTAVGGGGRGGLIPFDRVPSFTSLPQSVQQFLRDYAAAVAAGADGDDLAERLREFQTERLGSLPDFCTSPAT